MTIDASPATIMIVDDEPENLNVLGLMLRQEGWSVRAFPCGEMALAAAGDEVPDLVLLDIRMPGMDGYEVCRRFKANERGPTDADDLSRILGQSACSSCQAFWVGELFPSAQWRNGFCLTTLKRPLPSSRQQTRRRKSLNQETYRL
jgi:CheY-like chemotaxis protein